VTDADVVLGYIAPDNFLWGRMKLNADLAADAIQKHVADPLYGGDTLAAAAGIRRVTDSQMADLIRKTTLERGHDPRRFSMMAYGGSGPTHAASYGAEVGVGEIIIPLFASVLSAYGAARTDVRFSLQISDPLALPVKAARVEAIFARLEQQGAARLEDAHTPPEQRRFQRWVEARYRRQVHTVRVEVPKMVDEEGLQALADGFESEYERLFGAGSALREAGIELITFSIDAIGLVDIPDEPGVGAQGPAVPQTHRPAYCPHRRKMVRTPIYDGTAIGQGAEIDGPALIEHPGTTIVVFTGQRAQVDDFRHLHIFTGEPAAGEIDG
jgi:N-methylhydantoinase A